MIDLAHGCCIRSYRIGSVFYFVTAQKHRIKNIYSSQWPRCYMGLPCAQSKSNKQNKLATKITRRSISLLSDTCIIHSFHLIGSAEIIRENDSITIDRQN